MSDISYWVGYYESPYQTTPSFDPGISVPCPCCHESCEDGKLRTISLMPVDGERSLFFRAHKACWMNAAPEEKSQIESMIIDGPMGTDSAGH